MEEIKEVISVYKQQIAVLLVTIALVGAFGLQVVGEQPEVQQMILCKGIDAGTHQPIDKTNSFSASDPAVYCFVDIDTPRDVRVEIRWYTPNGDLYYTHNVGKLGGPSSPQGASGWYITRAINLQGTAAASMPGKWTVEVVLHPGRDETKSFSIAGMPPEKPEESIDVPPRVPPSGGDLLFSDDFSDAKSGWGIHIDGDGGYGYVNGAYYLDANGPGKFCSSLASRHLSNFVIDVDTTQETAPVDSSWGLICRYQDAENFYLFEISNDGYYAISALVDNAWTSLVDWTQSSAINCGQKATNHLTVTCQGNRLSLAINEQLVADIEDNTFTSGDLGFALTTYDQGGARILFDNVVVRQP